ncbi:MAG: ankyrin repeat domain-containing protein, partial [Pseudomonadota bacterium]
EALSTDPSLATKSIGPRRPILHLAFSRWIKHRPDLETQMLKVAELLLAHGADVDDGYPVEPGSDYMLPALYGAIGHANNMALGRWLLEHGADPNDGESLYHATELGHHEGLKMLLAHGADPKGTNALLRAMDFDDVEAVRMLLDHGARADDFDGTHVGGEAPWVVPALHQAARRWSSAEMVQLLLDKGADPKRVFEGAGTYGYARVFGNQAVAQAIEARGAATVLSWEEALLAMAADGEDTGGAQLDAAKLPVAYRNIIRMILHLPGRLSHVKRLVKLGLPFDAPDTEGLTPVHLAGWEGLPEVIAYFLSLGPDLFHVNSYGGGLISTIIHGSENCPQREDRDYVTCARLALDAGAPLQASVVRFTGNEDLAAFFDDWMAAHPDRIARE